MRRSPKLRLFIRLRAAEAYSSGDKFPRNDNRKGTWDQIMGQESGDSTGPSSGEGDKHAPPTHKTKPRRTKPNKKRTGELAEAAFLLKAASLGFGVTKPWGDSERYDFILDSGERLWRVQVKCTETEKYGYKIPTATFTGGRAGVPYTAEDIDVLVAQVVPLDVWYVVPVEAFAPRASLRFFPAGSKRARFEQYREAWHLLRAKPQAIAAETLAFDRVGAGALSLGPRHAQFSRDGVISCPAEPSSDAEPTEHPAKTRATIVWRPSWKPGMS